MEDIGSWVRFPDTLHEGYAHVAELMGKFIRKGLFISKIGNVIVYK